MKFEQLAELAGCPDKYEFANALTCLIFLPHYAYRFATTEFADVRLAALGGIVSMTISGTYHYKRGSSTFNEQVAFWRALDVTFVTLSFALVIGGFYDRVEVYLTNALYSLLSFWWLRRESRQFCKVKVARVHALPANGLLFTVAHHGRYELATIIFCTACASFWLFMHYPFGKYSHALFHLILLPANLALFDELARDETAELGAQ